MITKGEHELKDIKFETKMDAYQFFVGVPLFLFAFKFWLDIAQDVVPLIAAPLVAALRNTEWSFNNRRELMAEHAKIMEDRAKKPQPQPSVVDEKTVT